MTSPACWVMPGSSATGSRWPPRSRTPRRSSRRATRSARSTPTSGSLRRTAPRAAATVAGGHPGDDTRIRRHEQGFEAPRVPLRRQHHLLCLHAERRSRRRPRRELLPSHVTPRRLSRWPDAPAESPRLRLGARRAHRRRHQSRGARRHAAAASGPQSAREVTELLRRRTLGSAPSSRVRWPLASRQWRWAWRSSARASRHQWMWPIVLLLIISGVASLGLVWYPMDAPGPATILGDAHQTAGTVGGVAQLAAALAFYDRGSHRSSVERSVHDRARDVPARLGRSATVSGRDLVARTSVSPWAPPCASSSIPLVVLWGLVALRLRRRCA